MFFEGNQILECKNTRASVTLFELKSRDDCLHYAGTIGYDIVLFQNSSQECAMSKCETEEYRTLTMGQNNYQTFFKDEHLAGYLKYPTVQCENLEHLGNYSDMSVYDCLLACDLKKECISFQYDYNSNICILSDSCTSVEAGFKSSSSHLFSKVGKIASEKIEESCTNEIDTVDTYEDAIRACHVDHNCNCVTRTTTGFKTYQNLTSEYASDAYSWHVVQKEQPREIVMQDVVDAFLATGCQNSAPYQYCAPYQYWLDNIDSAFYDMMVYCVKTKDGSASQKQLDRCCGPGVSCIPESCNLQVRFDDAGTIAFESTEKRFATFGEPVMGGCDSQNELGSYHINVNLQSCAELCSKQDECVSFEFNEVEKICSLSSSCVSSDNSITDKMLYVKEQTQNIEFTAHHKTCNEMALPENVGISLTECSKQCLIFSNCQAFEYRPISKECILSSICNYDNAVDSISSLFYQKRALYTKYASGECIDEPKTVYYDLPLEDCLQLCNLDPSCLSVEIDENNSTFCNLSQVCDFTDTTKEDNSTYRLFVK
eukprot:Awhi_evm1s7611